MGAELVGEQGTLNGLTLTLEREGDWVIGRDPDESNLLIKDPSASRKHALCRKAKGGYVLRNLSATNPALVNDVPAENETPLKDGDRVKIGDTIFRFALVTKKETEEDVAMATAEREEEHEESKDEMETYYDTIFQDEDDQEEVSLAKIDFRIEEAGRWLIKVIAGPNTGAEFSMHPGAQYLVGTDSDSCDIVFHDVSVSRQHAKLVVGGDNELYIEDLNSRNGVLVNDELIAARTALKSNSLVTLGTTTFLIIDREGSRETIVSPPVTSMRERFRPQGAPAAESARPKGEKQLGDLVDIYEEDLQKKSVSAVGTLVLLAILTGVFVIVAIGATSLFREERVVTAQVDYDKGIQDALRDFPQIRYSFNRVTGKLLLIGHVLNAVDKNQIMYNLQGMKFITGIDDNVVIDEYVWQETNRILGKNPDWRGVTVIASAPGKFQMTGYLKTRAQEASLNDYMNVNFPYLDLLDRQIVVEEVLLDTVRKRLQDGQFFDVAPQINNGELALTGVMRFGTGPALTALTEEFQTLRGVKSVRNYVVELAQEESLIDLSNQYAVTGHSGKGGANQSVVINGKILSRGDTLDGMTITSIKRNIIMLEREGFKFKIEYNQ